MTIGKIMITQDQATAIETWLKTYSGDKAGLINAHVKGPEWVMPGYKAMNGLSPADMARALLIGYEVKPEYKAGDKVARVRKSSSEIKIYTVKSTHVPPHLGYATTITFEEQDSEGYINLDVDGTNYYLRHATPEEIEAEKLRRVWKDVVEGDVLRHSLSGRLGLYVNDYTADGKAVRVQTTFDTIGLWSRKDCELYAKKIVGESNA